MLVREEPSTELTVATRILARAGALPDDGHATLRVGEVMYAPSRGVSNHTMTPYDVVILRIADGDLMWGDPPNDVDEYLLRYRTDRRVSSVIASRDGLVVGSSLRACALLALGDAASGDAIETTWRRLVAEARVAGTLIGAFPAGTEG